ncbi:MAG: DoxX family membrane protein [Aquaticitalea sp.]
MSTQQLSFLLLRVSVGMSMLGHGLVRLPKLTKFATGMTQSFEDSMLPDALVLPFGYVLPILELAIGILLLLGLLTKQALVAGAVLMICLIFGSSLIENWAAINMQLMHTVVFVALLAFINYNSYAVDSLIKKK